MVFYQFVDCSHKQWLDDIARIHQDSIHHGILEKLSRAALARLYCRLGAQDGAVLIAALREGKVVGFISGCCNVRSFIGSLWKDPYFLLLVGISPGIWANCLSAVRTICLQPASQDACGGDDLPEAELFSIAVTESVRGQRVGERLLEHLEIWFQSRKVSCYKISTDAAVPVGNEFYRKMGFHQAGQSPHYALTLNTYQKRISIPGRLPDTFY